MPTLPKTLPDEVCARGRGRPRDEEARQRILKSALTLVEEVGLAAATTDAIAERAGASKATIYRWWPNKSAILIEALRHQVARELPFPDTGSLEQDIHGQLQNFVKLMASRRGRIFKALIAAAQSEPEVAEAFRTLWIQPRRREAIGVLKRHQQSGALRADLDLNVTLDMMYGPIYFRLFAGHSPLNAEFARELADTALRSLTT